MPAGRRGIAGLVLCLTVASAVVSPGAVVINEIHYDPPDNAVPEEFIELHNSGPIPVDLSRWALGDGIEYTIPDGTVITAGGYLLVAQDPATVASRFGISALGPWVGRLDGEGERIVLRDATDTKMDEVDYGNGFPWPIAAAGDGASMELLHPDIDNDLGSSWRSSMVPGETGPGVPAMTLLSAADTHWLYRKGINNNPPTDGSGDAWSDPGYDVSADNVSWVSGAQTPVGYDDGDDNTVLSDMRYNYSTVYLRNTFQIPNATAGNDVPADIVLSLYVDDGCIAYINGNEVTRQFTDTNSKNFNSTTGVTHHEASWVAVTVSAADANLVEGINTLALHALNVEFNSSDFSIDAEVKTPGSGGTEGVRVPTPGAVNSVVTTNAPPHIRQVDHSPKQPQGGDATLITAKVTDPDGVDSVQLDYQVLAPGAYLPARERRSTAAILSDPYSPTPPNPDFEDPANWMHVAMTDNGTGGDAVAGDAVYSATLPGQVHRTLVRYRITVEDALGTSVRAPFDDDPSLNFAYFCYDGVPDFVASSRSVHPEGAGHVWSQDLLNRLPVYHWITRTSDTQWLQAYSSADQFPNNDAPTVLAARRYYNVEGAFVYDGVVYDHVRARLRGGNSRYDGGGKRHYKFKFNRGHYFQARDQDGKKYPVKWRVFNTNRMFGNKGPHNWGLPEEVSAILWRALDIPAQFSHWFHFRVIDSPDETGQYAGDFWGLSQVQERYDVRFLEAHDLEKGNLYKLADWVFDAASERRYQSVDGVSDGSDYENIRWNLHGGQTEPWLNQYVDYDQWYRYSAVVEAIRHYDVFPEPTGRHRLKNLAWYFKPVPGKPLGECWFLPYDWDASWGPNWNNGWDQANNGLYGFVTVGGQGPIAKPDMTREHRNVLRAFTDLVWQRDQIEGLIDHRVAVIEEFSGADRDRWNRAPSAEGSQNPWTVGEKAQDMKNFAFVGWSDSTGPTVGAGGRAVYLDQIANFADTGLLPGTPTLAYEGAPGFPVNDLVFRTTSFTDPQGSGTFAAMEWRLAEVTDPAAPGHDPAEPFKLEWNADWRSGELPAFATTLQIPGIYVQTGRTYRVRARFKDTSKRWGHWSAPIEFRATDAELTADLRHHLVFSEIMYNPLPSGVYTSSELEFIELKNTGPDPLDLSGLTFLAGVEYTFSANTILLPGDVFLLGADADAFAWKYPRISVDGEFGGKLSDGGETLTLGTPAGDVIISVKYGDAAPWPITPDGMGWSLVVTDEGSYRASATQNGSPGMDDPSYTIPSILINEVLTHTDLPQVDTVELLNPTANPVDVSGWVLTDDTTILAYRIPDGTTLSAGGYLLLDEHDFNPGGTGFAVSSTGDDLYLFSGTPGSGNLTGYAHGARLGAAFNGVSFGRHVNTAGRERFVALEDLSLGAENGRPQVGPLVITEIMFHPDPAITNATLTAEFLEIQNIGLTSVPLWDVDHPLNGWRLRKAVKFDFHPGTSLAAGERMLVVGFDPNAEPGTLSEFRSVYQVDPAIAVYGPWTGRLDNAGETVELQEPDSPNLDGTVPYPVRAHVEYDSAGFWPTDTAGTGKSLQRRALLAYGDEPTNWFSAPATAGRLDALTSNDVDGDGLDDHWEQIHETDAYVPDGFEDPDGDGMANWEEAFAGTHPNDADSLLRVYLHQGQGSDMDVAFDAMAERTYSILALDHLVTNTWIRVQDVSAAPTNRAVTVSDRAEDIHFYRVVTPALP